MTQSLLPSSHQDTFTRDRLPPQDQWPLFVFERLEVQYPAQLNCVSAHVVPSAGVLLAWITKPNNERSLHVTRTRFRATQHG